MQERVVTALEDLAEDGRLPTVRSIRERAQIGSHATVMIALAELEKAGTVRVALNDNGRPSYFLANYKCPMCGRKGKDK